MLLYLGLATVIGLVAAVVFTIVPRVRLARVPVIRQQDNYPHDSYNPFDR